MEGLEARHTHQVDELLAHSRQQEGLASELQQRLAAAGRQLDAAVQRQETKHATALEGARRQGAEAAASAEERRRLDIAALMARMQAAAVGAEEALRAVVGEHAAAMRKVGWKNVYCSQLIIFTIDIMFAPSHPYHTCWYCCCRLPRAMTASSPKWSCVWRLWSAKRRRPPPRRGSSTCAGFRSSRPQGLRSSSAGSRLHRASLRNRCVCV